MLNAEVILELEKRWKRYKIKQNIRYFIAIFLTISLICFTIYEISVTKQVKVKTAKKIESLSKLIERKKVALEVVKDEKPTKVEKVLAEKNINLKPYHFKLEPSEEKNGIFSLEGHLTLNILGQEKAVKKAKSTSTHVKKVMIKKPKKEKILINMKEVDAISYLKERYYATSNIVFSLMLAEEYFEKKKYKETLEWALTANDIDSKNIKSWYWFAKAKVKLNKKSDAIRALKAYLLTNKSQRLSTLLHKIENGGKNDN